MQKSENMDLIPRKDDEPFDVSYSVLYTNKRNHDELLQELSVGINLQLSLNDQYLPFVDPVDFDSVKYQDKLLIYGPSGSGKSRIVFEVIKYKKNVLDTSVEKVYIINPRQKTGEKTGRTTLVDLMNQITKNDIIIWDNFPDDLLKRDKDSAINALEIISSKQVHYLIIAIKPKYLEVYRGINYKIPEVYGYGISYNKEKIKNMIQSYGKNIKEFSIPYKKYIENDLHKISNILWEKEPIPLTILNYFKELDMNIEASKKQTQSSDKTSLDAVSIAKKLLGRTDYYTHQFTQLANLKERKSDLDFIYTLRLCYELRLDRELKVIEHLQSGIFGSNSDEEIVHSLNTWIYLSGRYYSMHDAPREAVRFTDSIKIKIVNYLVNNFTDIIPDNDNQIYQFGLFMGNNISLIHRTDSEIFLPDSLYTYMKRKRYFELSLGQGVGEVFASLDELIQRELLYRIKIDGEFARGLGDGLGTSFQLLDKELQKTILQQCGQSLPFARGLGESLGRSFHELEPEIQSAVFSILTDKKHSQFDRGLGTGLGHSFLSLDYETRKKIFDLIQDYLQFTVGLGFGLGNNYRSLPEILQDELLKKIDENRELARGFGLGLGRDFRSLPQELQEEFFKIADRNHRFAFGLGYEIGYSLVSADVSFQEFVFYDKVEKNSEFAYGVSLGLGIAFQYLNNTYQKKILDKIEKNSEFAYGLGYGVCFVFKYLPQSLQQMAFEKAEKNSEFAWGAGYGIGYTFNFLDKPFQKKMLYDMIERNSQFAYGLGFGLVPIFEDLSEELQEEFLTILDRNSELSRGFGFGLGSFHNFISKKLKDLPKVAKQNKELIVGLGMGYGDISIYFDNKFNKNYIFKRADEDSQFAYGLGCQLGHIFGYLEKDSQDVIFRKAESNILFAQGLGDGLGRHYYYLNKQVQEEILKKVEKNIELKKGLGIGMGRVFSFQTIETQRELLKMAKQDVQFAIGLGMGMGLIFAYTKQQMNKEVLDLLLQHNTGLTRGYGIGMGRVFSFQTIETQQEMFNHMEGNIQLSLGLGEGIGQSFIYLDEEHKNLQSYFFKKAHNDNNFARGLVIGIGSIFWYLNEESKKRIYEFIHSNDSFELGFGEGIGRTFGQQTKKNWKDDTLDQNFKNIMDKPVYFSRGLGYGLAPAFLYFSSEKRNTTFDWVKQDRYFAKGFGFALGHYLNYMSEEDVDILFRLASDLNFDYFVESLGDGLGHNFPSLSSRLQEKVLATANENSNFAKGFGYGLAHSFKYLNSDIKKLILELGLYTNIEFE
jgi:hypothetical protein